MTNKNENDIIEEIYLKDYKNFVKVDNVYYGGDQDWLSSEGYVSEYLSNRSCGLVAVSNTLFHMFKSDEKAINLKEPTITKENFIDLVLYLYKFIKPKVYGIPTIPIMIKGLKRYAEKMNFEIIPFLRINPSTKLGTIEYIKEGLKKDHPIMMLTWNTKIKNLKYHWVTITGYYLTKSGEHYIVTSNWGKEETFSLDQWFDEKSFYKGLLYFTILNPEMK